MILKNKKILIISSEKWGAVKLSKHHYAIELSQENTIYFLNPYSLNFNKTKESTNLYIIDYKGVKGLNRLPNLVKRKLQLRIIQKIMDTCGVASFDLVWSFDPYSFQNLSLWKKKYGIYHPMDHHKTKHEIEIAKSADCIFAPSDLILNKFKDIDCLKAKINHGLSKSFLNKTLKNEQRKNQSVEVGYVGNLSSAYLDLKIVKTIVAENPEINFTFIGPIGKSNISEHALPSQEINDILNKVNVKHIDKLSPDEYSHILHEFDLFLLSYVGDDISISNSHKILEYLSTGSAIVSGPIDEYKNKPELLTMANSIKELPKVFKMVVNELKLYNEEKKRKVRIEFSQKNSYKNQIARIERILPKCTQLFQNKTIVIISPERWGEVRVSKHHYAETLAQNNRVIFINPPSNTNDSVTVSIGKAKIIIVNYKKVKGLNRLPKKIRMILQKKIVDSIFKTHNLPNCDIVWSFDPYVFQDLDVFDARRVKIFHPVDVHDTKLDFELANSVDCIFCTADAILSKYNKISKPKLQINHGIDNAFISREPTDKFHHLIKTKNKIKVGYVGNLQSKLIDLNILQKIVTENPNVDFYFIGPKKASNIGSDFVNNLNAIETLQNSHFLGAFLPKEFVDIINLFDAFLICYDTKKKKPYLANPHKIMEYLSTGKTLVASYTDQYKDNRGLFEMVDDIADLPALFKKVVTNLDYYNSEENKTIRIAYARENTYEKQIEKIERFITEELKL